MNFQDLAFVWIGCSVISGPITFFMRRFRGYPIASSLLIASIVFLIPAIVFMEVAELKEHNS